MTHNTREGIEEKKSFNELLESVNPGDTVTGFLKADLKTTHHQELQKAREEERERIEAVFKEHVPPHAMDLEDSVWLKRLLNKVFGHEN